MRELLRKATLSALIAVAGLPAIAIFGATPAAAANGDLLRSITAANPEGCGLNIGVAFDGTDLLVSCASNNVINKVSPVTGALTGSITAVNESGLGALAYDSFRGKIWACSPAFGSGVVLIDPVTGTSSNQISGACQDGLAYDYDGVNESLWMSSDVSCIVEHRQINGTLITSFNVCSSPGWAAGFGNSGIAVGGSVLYLSNNGGQQIYQVPKDFSSATLFATLTQRLEDMECDPVTFAPKTAIWVIDAYDRQLNAFEITAGSCGLGGNPTEGPPGDPTCSDGIDNDRDGLIDSADPDCVPPAGPCHGRVATIVGTPGPDTIVGTAGTDVIVSLGGDDHISGLGGDDYICAGDGNDMLNGGGGNDFLSGESGDDSMFGDAGRDAMDGGPGNDIGNGGSGGDSAVNTETVVSVP